MNFFICLCCFLIFLIISSKKLKLLDKNTAPACQNPIYIISTLDYNFLDLTNIPTCTTYGASAKVLMSRSFPSWCYVQSSSALVYNGRSNNKNQCPVSLYGDTYGDFEAFFPRAMVNPNWMKWKLKALGKGLTAIYSLGPQGTNLGSVLTWNGKNISLATYDAQNIGQKWLIANAFN